MLKVLHVITQLGPGGIERWLPWMLGQIPRSECAMDICCKGDSVGRYALIAHELGTSVYLQPLRVTQVGFISGLRRLVTSGAYIIVHNHLQVYSWLPVFACRNLGVPVITSFHYTEDPSDTTLRLPVLRPHYCSHRTLRRAEEPLWSAANFQARAQASPQREIVIDGWRSASSRC
jgi:hypothetical protein